MSIFSKLFTKKVKVEGKPDDFVNYIRFTSKTHGPFLASSENKVKWGKYYFGKLDGAISTALSKYGVIHTEFFKKGNKLNNEILSVGENNNGVPYKYSEFLIDEKNSGIYHNFRTYKVAKCNDTLIQKIVVEDVNILDKGIAVPKTIVLRYEPEIGASIYPVLVNSFKDIEVGKMYTRWFRATPDGSLRMIAMARSSMTEDNNHEYGYSGEFDEIILMSNINSNPMYFDSEKCLSSIEERFKKFESAPFGTVEYSAIAEKEGSAGLVVNFNRYKNGECDIIGTVTGTNESNNRVELTAKLRQSDIDLLLFDLKRGSGSGIADVRAFIAAQQPNDEKEDQLSESKMPDIPSENEAVSEAQNGLNSQEAAD